MFNNSFRVILESIQYNAALAVTGAIKAVFRKKRYQELGSESLQQERVCCCCYCCKTKSVCCWIWLFCSDWTCKKFWNVHAIKATCCLYFLFAFWSSVNLTQKSPSYETNFGMVVSQHFLNNLGCLFLWLLSAFPWPFTSFLWLFPCCICLFDVEYYLNILLQCLLIIQLIHPIK